jgi:acetolactate synthase-1/2/3 large subunit
MASQPQRAEVKDRAPIAGEAFLRALADHGIDYFFANPGTDFAPVVEAFSRAKQSNAKVPTPLVIPHENLAVAMAHGAYLMTGRPQAVMLHVNVGTANAINNIINLNRDNVPLILAAGGTPITEKGKFGSRNRYIHWAQEMFDQAGMLREAVKWDYELRVPEQVGDVVSRAYEVTMTSPRGPVYLVLPRDAGRMDYRRREAADHRHDGRGGRGRAARATRREIRDPGGHPAPARGVPADRPSDAHGLRSAGFHPGG